MTQDDPRQVLAHSPMTPAQIVVVTLCVCLTALDGFDVLAISFAAPGIEHDWGIDRAALGIVLSMELLGMAIGSILAGGVADRIGRRYAMLACLLLMTIGMSMAATARSVFDLSIWRVFTGLGIGGILATSNAVAAEFASLRRRDLCVSLMATGYPLGAIAGGSIAALLLRSHDWRSVFVLGAVLSACFLPITFWRLPESVTWLCDKQPARALARINRSLGHLGYASIASLPEKSSERGAKRFIIGLFRPGLAATTVLVTLTYFLHITTFYFMLKWVPTIVADMGFAASAAAGVLVWANVGGASGGAVLGLLAQRFNVKHLTMVLLVGSTMMVAVFGHGQASLPRLSLICAAAGFFTNGAVVGIYAIIARAFPTEVRASGTGFAIGCGRGGAVLAPIIAGHFFRAGYTLQSVAILMGAGSLFSALCLSMIRLPAQKTHAISVN